MTIFRVKGMTLKIDQAKWDHTSNSRLKSEFEEFMRWFGSCSAFMTYDDLEKAHGTATAWRECLRQRGINVDQHSLGA